MSHTHARILTDLLSLPTAPFAEHEIIGYVRDFCRARPSLRFSQDAAGNVLIRHGRKRRRPLVLAAHMDHPGFIAVGPTGEKRLRAEFHGGVRPEYFENARVRFHCGGRWVRGRLLNSMLEPQGKDSRGFQRVAEVEVQAATAIAPGSIGMWDLPDPTIRNGRVHARGCDDIAGVAAILACLDELAGGARETGLLALLTRAEEVGFAGAIAACRHRSLPADAIIVAIECSSEIPAVKMGDGPILRVGDFSTSFTPAATAWCRTIADQLKARDPAFTFQRKLMDGGTCESAVYCRFGYEATGICVALGNYHNMDRKRGRLAPEYINLQDWHSMVKWFVAMATADLRYDGTQPVLRKRLAELEARYRRRLRQA
jgi:endoglucanase